MFSKKDVKPFSGVMIICFCAVLICMMFANFYLDLQGIKADLTSPMQRSYFDVEAKIAQIIVLASGLCLFITALASLCFYISTFIRKNAQNLGILKALGYSNWQLARQFSIFGFLSASGVILGFALSFLLMPFYYNFKNDRGILPKISIQFHWELLIYFIVLPSLILGILAMIYAYKKLGKSTLQLLKGGAQGKIKQKLSKPRQNFLLEVRRTTITSQKVLAGLILFAAFCFASMVQLATGIYDFTNLSIGFITMMIGVILAVTILVLSLSSVVEHNRKNNIMMKVFGYTDKQVRFAILNAYRLFAYAGFLLGTIYQYILLKGILHLASQTIKNMPNYEFNFQALFLALIAFIMLYEGLICYFFKRLKNTPLKELMFAE
ncbi:FtsX-like permease family protein [Streptococcus massiliensis]|uniref:ABC transporter permease n=1 Tax=Streptococcus massiliensis TaxID=313439 RepID=A0A380KX51_9STRE|nr:ABC transporter permease [Streptococcus massiliensis]SUN76225.1 ABC transporter permease [Streptococcus massiliensis]